MNNDREDKRGFPDVSLGVSACARKQSHAYKPRLSQKISIYDADLYSDIGVSRTNTLAGISLLHKRWEKGMLISRSKWERENCGSGEKSPC